MKRLNFYVKSLTSSDSPIEIHPTWGYSERNIIHKDFKYGQEAQLNSFRKVGSYQEHVLPIDFISSADANVINGWWANQTNVDFTYNKDESDETSVSVRIINSMIPFGFHVRGSFVSYYGSLILKTY